jgi:threonine aldolase
MTSQLIELRSDTFTKPTPPMLEAMMRAKVGDDVFGEDPTVCALEEKAAGMFGMEAGLFCPSGTMTNQIAIRIHTEPQDEVICDRLSHVYNYEGGGIAYNSLASVRLLDGDLGRLSAEQIEEEINPPDVHFARTKLVCLENTVNKGGGSIYTPDAIRSIRAMCDRHGLKLHLDGARLFNALVAQGTEPTSIGPMFHTVSICLSKGLGCPVGSLLLGSRADIQRARRIRKVLGGGMRQAGFLAGAGLYALDHHVERLHEDHAKAHLLWMAMQHVPGVSRILSAPTNIVIAFFESATRSGEFLQYMLEKGVRIAPFGKTAIRMVTHLDVSEEQIRHTCNILKHYA